MFVRFYSIKHAARALYITHVFHRRLMRFHPGGVWFSEFRLACLSAEVDSCRYFVRLRRAISIDASVHVRRYIDELEGEDLDGTL